ncbi:protein SENESCENCE-ASSOCIATED GENE 21, mitochondrial [Raphanus sativus]|uniref:Protein SENESCENCE-ASSOCIATED GENE 21, mitochondrial n=1 Tax=Raphanus sativus TaxID=3726 RepID=A0A6J0KQH9_RAPSA|nr:protein SENESCENCE-ASSOCIATED GENE 21, mitochondrial [Raphanus sativus]
MARSLSNVKFLSAFVSQELSNAIFRRGYAATAAQSSSGKGRAVVSAVTKKGVEESNKKISWIPDPKTGYYRPDTGSNEIDPAELRAALLNKKQ